MTEADVDALERFLDRRMEREFRQAALETRQKILGAEMRGDVVATESGLLELEFISQARRDWKAAVKRTRMHLVPR